MINFNGNIVGSEDNLLVNNRGFLYGDGVFETMKVVSNKILFLEDHYFRLMSAMRILRMEIPMNFTMEYFEEQILSLANANNCSDSARARITVCRNQGGFYLPQTNEVSFIVQVSPLENQSYLVKNQPYEVELYKDFFVAKQLLSSIKSTNRLINITGSIFANENSYDSCLLLNTDKNVVEALSGNVFMLSGNQLITPPVADGCLNGVMRKQILDLLKEIDAVEVVEESISPFDLQKADELFISNVIVGLQSITNYRKKDYKTDFASDIIVKLNTKLGLN
jgi:branched-chain amino acid aminotransferase